MSDRRETGRTGEAHETEYEPEPDAQEAAARGVEIPLDAISAEALRGLVEAFVNREGTDYGEVERSFESKVADVMRQLERGEARIVFDPSTESATLVPAEGSQ